MVRAVGANGRSPLPATLAYTYTADGLRVRQAVDGAETTFAWDWASPVPELLSQSTNSQSTAYLIGHETLGWWDGAAWAYGLPDALGSIRQAADAAGVVVAAREWEPYGVEVGGAQEGPGYVGEWWDTSAGLLYLRARWYQPTTGRLTSRDLFFGYQEQPISLHPYLYVLANPVNWTDPAGLQVPPPEECEPEEICYTGTAGAQVTRSSILHRPSLPAFFLDPESRRRWCAQAQAEVMHRLREQRSSLLLPRYDPFLSMYGSLCCAESPSSQEQAFWMANPLGREVLGPILVDSGWQSFTASIIRGYGKRMGGPAIIATTVVFFSRMEATFVFYEHGTTIGIRDGYDTRSFFWVQPWLGTLSLARKIGIVTMRGVRLEDYLGEVAGAQEGSGTLPYDRVVLYKLQLDGPIEWKCTSLSRCPSRVFR